MLRRKERLPQEEATGARAHQELPVIVANHTVCSLWMSRFGSAMSLLLLSKKKKSTAKEWRKGNSGWHCLHIGAVLVAFGFPFSIPKQEGNFDQLTPRTALGGLGGEESQEGASLASSRPPGRGSECKGQKHGHWEAHQGAEALSPSAA